MRLILRRKGRVLMITPINSGVVVDRFFKNFHDISGTLTAQSSLSQSLAHLRESCANPGNITRFKCYLWVSKEEAQKDEEYFVAVKNLFDANASILGKFSEFKRLIEEKIRELGEDNWLTPEIEQIIYPYLASVLLLFDIENQERQTNSIPEALLEIHADFYPDGLLQKAEELHLELSAKHSSIEEHLKAIYYSLYTIAGVFFGIWSQAVSAGVIVVSGPLAAIPLVISLSLLFIGAAVQAADMRHTAKTSKKLALDKGVIELIGNLKLMASFINALFGIKQDTTQIRQNLQVGVEVLNSVRHDTTKIKKDLNEGMSALSGLKHDTARTKANIEVAGEALNSVLDDTRQIKRNTQVGAEALNETNRNVREIKAKIDNQQPAIVINNHLSEGAMRLLLEANARGELSSDNPLLLAFTQQAAPLQITGAPSGVNESSYVPRPRKLSALSTISEESSSPSISRSSTPPTDYSDTGTPPPSSKGKGKAPATLMVDAEQFAAFKEFQRQQEIAARLNVV